MSIILQVSSSIFDFGYYYCIPRTDGGIRVLRCLGSLNVWSRVYHTHRVLCTQCLFLRYSDYSLNGDVTDMVYNGT